MKRCIVLLMSLLLLGCASVAPPPVASEAVFHDALFAPPARPPDARTLFELTPAMRRHLAERIAPQVRRHGAPRALLDALYTQGDLRLEYESLHTRTAAEAFDERRGNCLSLVLMTAAFARELGLPVRFHEVLGTPVVERNGVLTFVVGHVNLALGEGLRSDRSSPTGDAWLVVDFLPGQDLTRQQRRIVDERRIAAMFMNNRAAEELAQGRVHEAYAWLRAAHAQDPAFSPLYNTLGIVYRHHGAWAQAERALQMAITVDPDNTHAADNLVALRSARAADELHRLAVGAAAGGDLSRARQHLQQAVTTSSTAEQRARFAAKLQRLKAQAAPSTLQ